MLKGDGGLMWPIDKPVREEIMQCEGNIVINASAGTGKTYTTIQRINQDKENNNDHRTFAAITFTRKAANEIASRLGNSKQEGFIGTNDNFIRLEIIQPFMHDVYGKDFKKEINPDFSTDNEIHCFNEGVEKINQTSLICKYSEVKQNFAFQLAYEILQKSHAARRYFKSKYFRIYIDEYQDSDEDMHNLFMYLCEHIGISLFIVGDNKQSIYGWRGAYPEGFNNLKFRDDFNEFKLWHNFRSNIAIQNYSNLFMEDTREHYEEVEFQDEIILYTYTGAHMAVDYIDRWVDFSESCAFLNFSNSNAKVWSELLNEIGVSFEYIPGSPLDYSNLESEHIWVTRALAKYHLQSRYNEYDFRDEIPMPDSFSFSKIKHLLKQIDPTEDNKKFIDDCLNLFNYLGYSKDSRKIEHEIDILFDVINDEQYIATYNQSNYKHTCGTIHSSKGLEFNQVIINAGDFNFQKEGTNFLHYVAITRPESRLLIIGNSHQSESYMSYVRQAIFQSNQLQNNIELNKVLKHIALDMD